MPVEIPNCPCDSACFGQTFRIGCGRNLGWSFHCLAVRPALETAAPIHLLRIIESLVLQADDPIIHLMAKVGEGPLLGQKKCFTVGRGLPWDERHAWMLPPPGFVVGQCIPHEVNLPRCRRSQMAVNEAYERLPCIVIDNFRASSARFAIR